MNRTMNATEARVHFGELLRQVTKRRTSIVIERAGRPQVIVLPVAEYERLRAGQPQQEDWRTLVAETHALVRAEVGDGPPLQVDEIIREMREERDAQLRSNLR